MKRWAMYIAIGVSLLGHASSIQSAMHGEGEKGPHGGIVRMPGAFHVEAVPVAPNSVDVYLLDLSNRNPEVLVSSVRGELVRDGNTEQVECLPQNDHFRCDVATRNGLMAGELNLHAVRREVSGRKVSYPLPLSLSNQ